MGHLILLAMNQLRADSATEIVGLCFDALGAYQPGFETMADYQGGFDELGEHQGGFDKLGSHCEHTQGR